MIKQVLRRGVERTLSLAPSSRLLARAGIDVVSLYYHTVWEKAPPWFRGNYRVKTPTEFEKDLDRLLKSFRPLSLAELIEADASGRTPAPNSLFLSFDDGYRELAEIVAPILTRKGVPATIFVTTDLIDNHSWLFEDEIGFLRAQIESLPADRKEACLAHCHPLGEAGLESLLSARTRPDEILDRLWDWFELDRGSVLAHFHPYLTTSQIRSLLSDGFAIGAHGADHTLLASLSIEDQIKQVRRSVSRLTETFGLGYRAFAFPYGEFGIAREFFERARDERIADIFFGTRGPVIDEFHPFLRQRSWCENHPGRIDRYLKKLFSEAALRGWREKNLVHRRQ